MDGVNTQHSPHPCKVGGGMAEDDLINFILMHPSPSQKWRRLTIVWEWMNKKKGFIIYKCENFNATAIPFLLSCKLLNQLKDIESLIEDGGRGVAYQTYCSFSKNRSHLYR